MYDELSLYGIVKRYVPLGALRDELLKRIKALTSELARKDSWICKAARDLDFEPHRRDWDEWEKMEGDERADYIVENWGNK